MTTFFRNLLARKPEGQSVSKFMRDLDISTPCWARWKKGGMPRWEMVERLGKRFGCEPTDLLKD
jgi:hypothetical protein